MAITAKGTARDKEDKSFVKSPTRKNYTAQEVFVGNQVATTSDDSFGRIKVSPPHLLFDASFQYTKQDEVFVFNEINNGTVVHDTTRASIKLNCSSDAGSSSVIRSRNYFPYSPAFTNSLIASFNFHQQSSATKRIGLYNASNGYFLELNENGLCVVIRSSISGSVVENRIYQADFNIDVLDGSESDNNPSRVLLDVTKQQIMYLEFQWLGSGRVVFGFNINGINYSAHEFYHSNIINSLYSQTATLPFQADIYGGGDSDFFEFTCCSLVSNGAPVVHGHLGSISSNSNPKALPVAGTTYPFIAIRKKPNFDNVPIQIVDFACFSTTNDDLIIEAIMRPTLINAVWQDIPNTLAQVDFSATGYSGGKIINQFYMKGNLQLSEKIENISKFWDLVLGSDINNQSDIFLLVAKPLSNNANVFGLINFKVFE